MAAGIGASRAVGLVREQFIVIVLGTSKSATAFRFAMRVPNLMQNLLGEGALSASFIPVYSKLLAEGRHSDAAQLAKRTAAALAALTIAIVAFFIATVEPIIRLATDWEADPDLFDQAVELTRIATAGIGFLVMSAWCLGVLNSHRKFFTSYVAPVIWNLAQITALAIAIAYSFNLPDAATWVAWAVVVGGLGQLGVQLAPTLKLVGPSAKNGDSTSSINIKSEFAEVLKRFGHALWGRGIIQVSSYLDTFLLAALVVTALPIYTASLPLYLLPISLFGFSVAAAELPELSRLSDAPDEIATRVNAALKRVLIPAGIVTATYLTLSVPVIDALYGLPNKLKDWLFATSSSGTFGDDQIIAIALVLTGFALGLPAVISARVTQNALYSLGDVKGPARIAAVRLIVSLVVATIAMVQLDWLFIDEGAISSLADFDSRGFMERVPETVRLDTPHPHLGPVGLSLAASLAGWIEWYLLRKRLSKALGRRVTSGYAFQILVSTVLAGATMALTRLVDLPSPLDLVAAITSGGVIYLIALQTTGSSNQAEDQANT